MMRVLMFGLGSIGQRHVSLLKKLLGERVEIAAYRQRGLDLIITDTMEASYGKTPDNHYGIISYTNIEKAFQWKPDIAFITNPNSMHVETAIKAAENNCHIFIEKPLGVDLHGINELKNLIKQKKLVCMVGYQLRFHPALVEIKEHLNNKHIGRLISAHIHFGEWLPGMHPYEDYKSSYASKSDQGGGVILSLSHEIDYACWLFGVPEEVYARGGHLSELEIDVEDSVDMIMTANDAGRPFPVHVHLDFLQKPAKRCLYIIGDRGTINWNYNENHYSIATLPQGDTVHYPYNGVNRNNLFMDEIESFISSVEKGEKPKISLDDGIVTLKVCLAAKRSIESGTAENV